VKLRQLVGGLALVAALAVGGYVATSGTSDAAAADQDPHPANACSEPYHVSGAAWDFCWQREDTRVQGLEINRAFFNGESVIWKMGVPFSLTEYDQSGFGPGPYKDVLGTPGDNALPGFGRGSMQIDQEACPRFQSQGQLVDDGRVCIETSGGVAPEVSIWSRYDVFNYRFLQGYHFDDRGVVEPWVALGGQLLDGATVGAEGANHNHHVYWRVDYDIAQPGGDAFQAFKRVHGEVPVGTFADGVDRATCETVGSQSSINVSANGWCDAARETKLTYEQDTHDKWRVVDQTDANGQGHDKSFQFVVRSAGPAGPFSSFDAMALDHAGDSEEIGYEVGSSPIAGDAALNAYLRPPEEPTDPVAWVANHVYHETRDEERGSMTYHYAGFEMSPRDFVDENPAEETFP